VKNKKKPNKKHTKNPSKPTREHEGKQGDSFEVQHSCKEFLVCIFFYFSRKKNHLVLYSELELELQETV